METMKPGIRKSPRANASHAELAPLVSRAERLVAEYLRAWGLRDPQTLAQLSREWVRRAIHVTPALRTNPSLGDLYRAAMRLASTEMRDRLHSLTQEVCGNSDDRHSRAGLMAIELQSMVDQHPDLLADDSAMSATQFEQLAGAARPLAPPTCHRAMLTQSLDATSAWTRLSRTTRRMCQAAIGVFSRGEPDEMTVAGELT